VPSSCSLSSGEGWGEAYQFLESQICHVHFLRDCTAAACLIATSRLRLSLALPSPSSKTAKSPLIGNKPGGANSSSERQRDSHRAGGKGARLLVLYQGAAG